jgi:hypothetical protein
MTGRDVSGNQMLSLYQVVKINFLCGAIGTLVSMPFLYWYEFLKGGPLAKFDGVDAGMLVAAPLIAGFFFAVTAVLAFPVLRFLQRRGVIHRVL